MANDFVVIQTYDNPAEADMAKHLLEDEGILVFLENRDIVQATWGISILVGGVRLQVPRDQAELASQLLAEKTRRWPGLPDNEPMDNPELHCLECGELMSEQEDKCSSCGWSYADGVEP